MSQHSPAVLSSLESLSEPCDQTIVFRNTQFHVHRLVLGASSLYFHDLWTGNWKDTAETTIVIEDLPVSTSSFKLLIGFFYGKQLCITSDLYYQLFYLSRYFRVTELERTCAAVIEEKLNNDPGFLSIAVSEALQEGDLHFLSFRDLSKVLLEGDVCPSVTSPEVLEYYAETIASPRLWGWLYDSIVASCNVMNWTPEDLVKKNLDCISYQSNNLFVFNERLVCPLKEKTDFENVLFDLSITFIKNSNDLIPKELSLWLLNVCANNSELYDRLSIILHRVVDSIMSVPVIELRNIHRLLLEEPSSKHVKSLLRCLVKSWQSLPTTNKETNCELFSEFVQCLDLSLVSAHWMFNNFYIPLKDDDLIDDVLEEVYSNVITPRLTDVCSDVSWSNFLSPPTHISETITESYLLTVCYLCNKDTVETEIDRTIELFTTLHHSNHSALTNKVVDTFRKNEFLVPKLMASSALIRIFTAHASLSQSDITTWADKVSTVLSTEERLSLMNSNIPVTWKMVMFKSLIKEQPDVTKLAFLFGQHVINDLEVTYDWLQLIWNIPKSRRLFFLGQT
ncbi:hypothetical protein GEMRC1_008794 [Eukaryota sp. GEM-RC1]